MTKRLLRLLAAALLALTVPVQGMAAVAAGQCMALGHHQQDAGDHEHGHAQDGAQDHEHDVVQDGDGGAGAHCGPCTACCASASIAGSPGLPVISSSTHTKYLFSQAPPPGVQPQRLDRPPLAL
jgi:hypothetical protein